MSVFDKIRSWWSKDALETADEETRMTTAERDLAERDYQGMRDDTRVQSGRMMGGAADYERDSEPPQ